MEIVRELLPGVFVIKPNLFIDNRGALEVNYHQRDIARITGNPVFTVDQAMWVMSKKYVIRGLHYQSKAAPVAKIVVCTAGVIYDVVVDLRFASPSYGKWAACELAMEEGNLLYIPVGIAHGYLSLSELSGVFYYQQGYYDPDQSRILSYDDPTLNINWPLQGRRPILSERDKTGGISWAEYKVSPEF